MSWFSKLFSSGEADLKVALDHVESEFSALEAKFEALKAKIEGTPAVATAAAPAPESPPAPPAA